MKQKPPVGRIDYYGSNREIRKSEVYHSPDKMVQTIKEKLDSGEPIGIVIFRNKDGPCIPPGWLKEISTLPVSYQIKPQPFQLPVLLRNDRIYYCDNLIGFVLSKRASVDTIFQRNDIREALESRGLELRYVDGLYQQLHNGEVPGDLTLKKINIWQLKPGSVDKMFIPYVDCVKKFGGPQIYDYKLIYTEESSQTDLEGIFTRFNVNMPEGFTGHSLSISDIIEINDDNGSTFHYVDHFGFQELNLTEPTQEPSMDL